MPSENGRPGAIGARGGFATTMKGTFSKMDKRRLTTLGEGLDIPAALALELAGRAVSAAGGKHIEVDPTRQVVTGKTGTSWRTWGQQLKVTVQSRSSETSLVEVSSAPKIGDPIFDFGSSKRMAADVLRRLTELAKVDA
jgi:hypothetical protein